MNSIIQYIHSLFSPFPRDPMKRAKLCLDTLRADYYAQFNTKTRNIGRISWYDYAKKYNLTENQIIDYCATLPRLELIHKTCPLCGEKWYSNPEFNVARPVSNGHIINYVDYIETFCVCGNEETDEHMWYYQYKDGTCWFSREIYINNEQFRLRWNCQCAEPSCKDKNVLYWEKHISRGNYNYIVLKTFDNDDPIFTAPRERVWEVAEKLIFLV